ncbi:MAG: sigma-54-dependent Fis family transcriptional regulator [Kofleriaceae bacterium]|nr:sigma-54-dependent Fis family transcriptional regulator [Myxococcales bacterium]MCB9562419.1 sigma-54-dependent Fis family transcriptional regulator [Kofleriaceae bacterium]
MGRVLVVDDERSMREFLAICLRRAGHDVEVLDSGAAALARAAAERFDVVVTDLRMPGELDGLALLTAIKQRRIDSEVVLVTAFATADTAIAAMKQGAYDYLTKPFKVDEINAVIGRAMEKRALVAENLALKDQVAGRVRMAQLLGRSKAMQKVFDLIGKIHSTRTSVLITGESGTGKELVARALHTEGARSSHAFVAVNCGAIPDELMESELFGHVKGAFTGAHADKPGLFRQAAGGTLFLDEIGELSLGLQVKLLRALQERKVKPVGGAEELEVDVRVVAATNRDLEAEVARGAFRQDLYYRLNVIELRLPPLRQRREDVPLLVEHFLRKFAADQGGDVKTLDAGAMKRLEEYDFPGNVRELENIVERAVALASGALLTVDDLPSLRPTAAVAAQSGGDIEIPDDGVDLDRLVYDYEHAIVQKALDKAGGVRKRAAGLLGISFRSLRYRLDKLGFERAGGDNGDDGDDGAAEA